MDKKVELGNGKVLVHLNFNDSKFLNMVARDRGLSLFLGKNLMFRYVFGVVSLENLRKFEKYYCILKRVIL